MIKNLIFTLFILIFCSFLVYFFVYPQQLQLKPSVVVTGITDISPTSTPTLEPTITPITIDNIFYKTNNLQNFDKSKLTTLVATGDFIPARSVNFKTLSYNDFNWSVESVTSYFTNRDIVLVSLETPLFSNCPVTNSGFVFCGEDKHISALKSINTSIVNVANNHFGNYAKEGADKSIQLLTSNNIKISGLNNLEIIEKNNIKFAFLGYNDIGYTPDFLLKAEIENIKKDILIAKEKADVVIVSFHFGAEYSYFPDARQVELARSTIDNGADLVIGNHPHSIQPIELYKGKVIMYAHGNFVFDQMWSEQTKQGVVGYYTFYKDSIVDINFKPIYIVDYGKSTIPDEKMSTEIINKLGEISREWLGR